MTYRGAGSIGFTRLAQICIAAGVLGVAAALFLLIVEPAVGETRFSYPLTTEGFSIIQVFFFVHHLGLLAGLYALSRSGAVGTGWVGRGGSWVAMGGMVLLSIAELVAITAASADYPSARTDPIDALYGVSSVSVGLGLILVGVAVIRTGRWAGWRRYVPLLLGVWVFIPMTPAMFSSFVLGRLTIGAWMALFGLLGYALLKESEDVSNEVRLGNSLAV